MNVSARRELIRRVRRELARQSILAAGRTAPNPAVAAVVIARAADASNSNSNPDQQIAAESRDLLIFAGGTEPAGSRHAEIVALDACRAAGAIPVKIYVTLEPCSHRGRTPPCTDRILAESELQRIVLYQADRSLKISGTDLLRAAGRQVRVVSPLAAFAPGPTFLGGFLERAAGRGPRYHIKYALSADGFMAGAGDQRLLISGALARRFVMALRSRVDAVLVGPGTVAGDLPGLDVRRTADSVAEFQRPGDDRLDWTASLLERLAEIEAGYDQTIYQPDRIFILGRRFPGQQDFFERQARLATATGRPPVYLTTSEYAEHWSDQVAAVLPASKSADFAPALRALLGEREYNEVLIEGGPNLLERIGPDLRESDRGYILRSRAVRAGDGRPGPRLPAARDARTFDLETDELESFGYSALRSPG